MGKEDAKRQENRQEQIDNSSNHDEKDEEEKDEKDEKEEKEDKDDKDKDDKDENLPSVFGKIQLDDETYKKSSFVEMEMETNVDNSANSLKVEFKESYFEINEKKKAEM